MDHFTQPTISDDRDVARQKALAMRAQYLQASRALRPLHDRVSALEAAREAIQPRFIRNGGRGYYAPLSKAAAAKRAKLDAAISAIHNSAEYDQAIALLNVAAYYLQSYKQKYHGDAYYMGDL